MASGYRQLKTTVAQTAANDAATIVAAAIGAGQVDTQEGGDYIVELFNTVFESIFAALSPVVDEDNALLVAQEDSAPAKSSTPRSRKTGGGGSSRSRGSDKEPSVDEAMSFRLRYGAFGKDGEDGLSLAEVLELTAEEADSDYGYGDGIKSGEDYIAWAASPRNKNDTIRKNALVVANAEGITPLEAFQN